MVNKYLALKGEDKFDISKVTVVGSPTITSDGIASNLSTTDYIQYTGADILQGKSWEILAKVYWDGRTYNYFHIGDGASYLRIASTKEIIFNGFLPDASQVWNASYQGNIIKGSGWYYIGVKFDYETGSYTTLLGTSIDNIAEINTVIKGNGVELRYLRAPYFITGKGGQVDINSMKIYTDGELVYTPTKPTYLIERRKEGFDLSKFTVVGSPTITNDGIATGFGAGNDTVRIEIPFDYLDKDFVLKGEFTLGTSNSATYIIGGWRSSGFLDVYKLGSSKSFTSHLFLNVDGTRTSFTIANNGSYFILPYNIQANESCLWYLKRTGSTYELGMKKSNAAEYTTAQVVSEYNLATPTNNRQVVATAQSADTLKSVDLKQYSIIVDDKEVFTGAKKQFYILRR